MILFCAGVPPSPPSAPSLVSRNATSFVSLLRKVPCPSSAPLSLSSYACARKGRRKERERKIVCSSHPSFLPPFLSFSSFLSFPHRADPSCLRAAVSYPSSLSLVASSRVLHGVIAHGSHSFSFSPSERRRFCPPVLLPGDSPHGPFPFRPLILPRVVFHPSSRQSISPPRSHRPHYTAVSTSLFPFPSSFFVPVDRGVLRSSNLNAGRTDVWYRPRKWTKGVFWFYCGATIAIKRLVLFTLAGACAPFRPVCFLSRGLIAFIWCCVARRYRYAFRSRIWMHQTHKDREEK